MVELDVQRAGLGAQHVAGVGIGRGGLFGCRDHAQEVAMAPDPAESTALLRFRVIAPACEERVKTIGRFG
jgi:hypothetical protein